MSCARPVFASVVGATVLALSACGSAAPEPPASAGPTDPPPSQEETAMPAEADPPPESAPPESAPPETASTAPAPPAPAPPPRHVVEGRNRLGDETSPYLLQHRHNPVHWWPWGPEAIAAARALDMPIFLSVGYSTCYWCHVMERESFENEAVAAIMNERFICIKVDREERPDVDDIYMTAVQVLTGRGGWPMSVFIDPHTLKPFQGGTYFPPEDRQGLPGFKRVLRQMSDVWLQQRERVDEYAARVGQAVEEQLALAEVPVPVGPAQVEAAVSRLLAVYDATNGGFGAGPNKFPTPVNLDLLIATGWDLKPARDAVLHTLDRMAMGGMYDQVGGGFHRYSTDREWLVPHFEKMLYDNGQLASTYAEAYERTRDPYYAQVLRETLDYVLREMTAEDGAFRSAQDAEVNHREGENYLWRPDQVRAALSAAGLDDDVDFALQVYGLDAGTNFQDPHHPEDGPKNVMFLVARPDELAARHGMEPDAFETRLAGVNAALLAVRGGRDQPITDDKVLAGWNGLMIAGMADGGRVLDEPRYIDAARRAAEFLLTSMRTDDGGLLRTSRGGTAKIDAFLEDYAYLVHGLLALHRTTGDFRLRDEAIALADAARTRFWDESGGAYYDTLPGQDDLFVRVKSTYDGATPSGNGVMLNNLVDLHLVTGDASYLDDALATLGALSQTIAERPTGCTTSVRALHRIAERFPERIGTPVPAGPGQKPVQVVTSLRTVRLAPGASETFDVTLRLAPGYHVNAHEPGIEYLIPLEVTAVADQGIELSVEYPAGDVYAGPEGTMLVHHDEVRLPVTVTRAGELTAAARLSVTYQVCTDQACLAPETEVLAVRFVAE
jgi:uncharacterized protein YyaL (SSP411 family)